MKRLALILIIATLLGFWILNFGFEAKAQPVYMGLYWITGSVSDPDSVGTEGRQVCFYETLENNAIVGGYADDLCGAAGLSGRTNQYMINALEDFRLIPRPGTYYVAIPNDNPADPTSGYGADPVEVTVTGQGYDIVASNLVLMRGAGILPPPPPPVFGVPSFEDITFGNRKYQAGLVARGQEFIVSSQPRVSGRVVAEYGLNASSIAMVVNEGTTNAKTYSIAGTYVTQTVGAADSPTSVAFTVDFLSVGDTLLEGEQTIAFRASNAFGATEEVVTVTVAGGEPRLIGDPITFPSPLHLKTDREVTFQYILSHDLNTEIYVFDVSGRIVLRRPFSSRGEGGSAGFNKVTWNLFTDQGSLVSSGIYVFTLVNRENGKLLGKGKLTALP